MDKFFEWLTDNSVATDAFVVSFGLLFVTVLVIYIIAFAQGREISFWPPKLGTKPVALPRNLEIDAKEGFHSHRRSQAAPSFEKGAVLETASGASIKLESNVYGGASATLFRASYNNEKKVIVKVYWRGLVPNSSAWDLFTREVRAHEVLRHRNIADVLDRGQHIGYPFIVIEYISGGTLRDFIESRSRIVGSDIYSIAKQVADAIDFAHSKGVVHRDIKPSNILLESGPHQRVVLSDFNVAKLFDSLLSEITAPEIVGTVKYASPEMIRGEKVTASTDIYSFGVVIFEMIANRTPFQGSTVLANMHAIANQDAPDIRRFRTVPDEIADRLGQTLSRLPEVRPRSANAVLVGLEDYFKQL